MNDSFLAIHDFEVAARKHLPRMIFSYIADGAESNAATRGNLKAYDQRYFLPRVLKDVSNRGQKVDFLGRQYDAPFGVAPMGAAAICGYRADLALASAAHEANIPYIVSAMSMVRMEEIIDVSPNAWYQAYLPGEDDRIARTLARAERAGFETLVVSVDVPVHSNRENAARAGFKLPLVPGPKLIWDMATHPKWTIGTLLRTVLFHGIPHFENLEETQGPPVISRNLVRNLGRRDEFSWSHVKTIRRIWKGPLILKGVLTVEDAKAAKEHGADAIVVSNHGGRQLDYSIPALNALERIASDGPEMPVILDGGIRRGTDVLKAMHFGANLALIGRPFLYAASVGRAGAVHRAISILMAEIDIDMALLGIVSPREAQNISTVEL